MQPQESSSQGGAPVPRFFALRISLLYATVYLSLGFHVPYFPVWLESVGMSAGEIAVVLSAPMLLRVVTTPFITAWADRAPDRIHVLVALILASLVCAAGYLVESRYLPVLLISLVLAVVWTPHGPLADSLALSGVRRFGAVYSSMRIWGSISFLVANFGGGLVIASGGAASIPAAMVIALALSLGAALLAPRLGRPRIASPLSATEIQAAPSLMSGPFLMFVLGCGLITGSHAFLYAFVSIYWKSLGIPDSVIGILWAVSVLAEVLLLMVFPRFFARRSVHALFLLAGLGAVVRWIAFPWVWPSGLGLAGFLFVQALHALSMAMLIVGVQQLIAQSVPEHRTGAAQGLVFFSNGVSLALATLASGPLYALWAEHGFLAMAAMAAAGTALVLVAGRSTPQGRGRG